MKKNNDPELEIILKAYPENLRNLILELLYTENFRSAKDARNALVSMGKKILPQLHNLLQSKNDDFRKKVAKIVELISDAESIPIFITLLEDIEFEIRWIAAEGLIKIGRKSIVPLLKAIRDSKSSYFLDKRTHHVLQNLFTEIEKSDLKALLLSLDNYLEARETAPTEAAKALEKHWPTD